MQAARKLIHIIQGEFHVSADPGIELATVLGSCVAACLHDPVRRIGGMNHFLLPGNDPKAGKNIKYGAHSMEQLINALLRAGAQRSRLRAQLFGGGNVVAGLSGIGERNAHFARDFVRDEGLMLVGEDLGGKTGRRLRFVPATGEARVMRFEAVEPAPRPVTPPPRQAVVPGAVDLF
jgi:chemotaxis protein CheD